MDAAVDIRGWLDAAARPGKHDLRAVLPRREFRDHRSSGGPPPSGTPERAGQSRESESAEQGRAPPGADRSRREGSVEFREFCSESRYRVAPVMGYGPV